MKVLFIVRSTFFTASGGDTQQVMATAKWLLQYEVEADIRLTTEKIDYGHYDLLHFFNVTRPADILYHIKKAGKAFVISPLWIDYSEYDRNHRSGVPGIILRFFSSRRIEYFKTIARWIKGTDSLRSISYLWLGQHKSIQKIYSSAAYLLANSALERETLSLQYRLALRWTTVSNGVDKCLFIPDNTITKDPLLVICVARIEGLKNQLNLIRALNNSKYRLILIGNAAPNQQHYYDQCRKAAAPNVSFIQHLPQQELLQYYQRAKVHILPSWFEVCGLSSLEAAAMGCNIVITDKGYTREYFEDFAQYCDPASPASILEAVAIASLAQSPCALQEKIFKNYSWEQAAAKTAAVYKTVLNR